MQVAAIDEVLVLAAPLVVFIVAFAFYYRRFTKGRDEDWQHAMRQLSWRERMRISRAVQRGERLGDPRDAALAVGAARESRRVHEQFSHGWLLHVVTGALLIVLAAVQGSAPLLVVGAALITLWVGIRVLRRRQLARLAEAERVNRDR